MKAPLLLLTLGLLTRFCLGQTPADPPAHLAKTYETAAAATFATGDYEKSMEYFSKAFPYLLKDPALIDSPGRLLTHAVHILIQQQLPSEALGILRVVDIPAVAAKHDRLDPEQILLGKGDCFYAMGENDSAQRYYRDAMQYVPNPGFSLHKSIAYETLANFYAGIRQYARASPLLDTLTAIDNRKIVPLETLTNAYFNRYRIDSASGDLRDALVHLRQYQVLHDSLAAIGKGRQLAEMDAVFETEMKTRQTADSNKQAGLLTQLGQANRGKNYILLAAAILLLSLGAALYSGYRLRRRVVAGLDALERNKQTYLDENRRLRREIHRRALKSLETTIALLPPQAGAEKVLTLTLKKLAAAGSAVQSTIESAAESTSIELPDYIRELLADIRNALTIQRPIVWRLDLADITLDVTQCVPLGCILNEAITSAIHHVFNDGSTPSPTIHISLKAEPENYITLCIGGNGSGLPADPYPAATNNLPITNKLGTGPDLPVSDSHFAAARLSAAPEPEHLPTPSLHLIQTLAAQLDGTLEITSHPAPATLPTATGGLTLLLRFPRLDPATLTRTISR